ncbi:MAG: hypothetical protein ACK6DZ_25570 [Acidobacteriota bacterium]
MVITFGEGGLDRFGDAEGALGRQGAGDVLFGEFHDAVVAGAGA